MIKISKDKHPTLIKMYVEDKLTLKEIADLYSVSPPGIAKILKSHGVQIKNGNNRLANRYAVSDYFERDTEGAAYFYGLMLADGCMPDRNKRLSIELQSDDSYILETLKSELNLPVNISHQVKGTSKASQLCFTVDGVYDSFYKLGFRPRKSTKEVAPQRFAFNRHFWRGMVDGDGSVSKSTSQTRLYLCGSLEICNQFLDYCKSINPSIETSAANEGGGLYRLSISGIKAATILNELYSEAEFKLNRKFKRSEDLIARYPVIRHVF